MDRDRLGRRRGPEQERGLRPLHPPLPDEWISRAVRVAMSDADWVHFDAIASRYSREVPTQARAYGLAIAELLHAVCLPEPEPGPFDALEARRAQAAGDGRQ